MTILEEDVECPLELHSLMLEPQSRHLHGHKRMCSSLVPLLDKFCVLLLFVQQLHPGVPCQGHSSGTSATYSSCVPSGLSTL